MDTQDAPYAADTTDTHREPGFQMVRNRPLARLIQRIAGIQKRVLYKPLSSRHELASRLSRSPARRESRHRSQRVQHNFAETLPSFDVGEQTVTPQNARVPAARSCAALSWSECNGCAAHMACNPSEQNAPRISCRSRARYLAATKCFPCPLDT